MRADAERADRDKAVREAARAWRRSGAIDGKTLGAIEAGHPDDRRRLGPALRALSFLFTALGLLALFLAFASGLGADGWVFCLVYGLLLLGLTEWQIGSLKRSEGGTESATGLVGLGFVLGGGFWLLDRSGVRGHAFELTAWTLGGVLCAAAFVRWGMEAYAIFSAACAFGLLSALPGPRLSFVLAALPLLALALAAEASPRLAPSHRRGAVGVQAVAVVALYLAVHLGSWDAHVLERTEGAPPQALRPLAIAATALLPLGLVATAIRLRRRPLLALGVLCAIASLVTLRFYVHLAPLWVVLTLGGLVGVGLALALERWLRAGPERQRGGYTSDPLFDGPRRLRALEIAVAATQAGPAAKRPASPELQPGGGRFGGGGATDSF
jgi:hypothetical protein